VHQQGNCDSMTEHSPDGCAVGADLCEGEVQIIVNGDDDDYESSDLSRSASATPPPVVDVTPAKRIINWTPRKPSKRNSTEECRSPHAAPGLIDDGDRPSHDHDELHGRSPSKSSKSQGKENGSVSDLDLSDLDLSELDSDENHEHTRRKRLSTSHVDLVRKGEASRVATEEALFNCVIFGTSPDDTVKELAERGTPKTVISGFEICHRGQPGDRLIIILSGSVSVTVEDIEVALLKPGDHWGEANLFGLNTKWDVTLTAQEDDTETCELTRDDFLNVMLRRPDEMRFYENLLFENQQCADHGTLSHTCELLHGLSNSTLLGIDSAIVRHLYFPGQTILTQGEEGDSMVILVRGQCDVDVDGKIVRQEWRGSHAATEQQACRRGSLKDMNDKDKDAARTSTDLKSAANDEQRRDCDAVSAAAISGSVESAQAPAVEPQIDIRQRHTAEADDAVLEAEAEEAVCFGELGLLGLQKHRTASIIAHSICQVRILYRTVFMHALESHHETLDMARMSEFFKKRYNGGGFATQAPALETLKSVGIFKEVGLSDAFLEDLSKNLEDRIFLVGQHIIDENVDDDRAMYILGQGSASVIKGGEKCGVLHGGAVFGEMVMLGLATKRLSTIVAEDVCYCQVLHQHHVVSALKRFPEERQKVLMIAIRAESGGAPCVLKPDGTPDFKATNINAVVQAVQSTKMFGKIGAEFIKELAIAAADRIFMPGELILEEGASGDSLFVMVSGSAKVYLTRFVENQSLPKIERSCGSFAGDASEHPEERKVVTTTIGRLTAGSICGELAMLGIAKTRTATVCAESICVMWEISNEKAMPIILHDDHHDSRGQFLESISNHLEHTVSNCIDGIDLFKKFDRKFRMLLGLYCDRHAFFPGQNIFREGALSEGLCVLNCGQARLERQSVFIKMCMLGSHFNSTSMLGTHKWCFCTLVAKQTCHVVVISRDSYLQAIEQYPSDQAAKDMVKQEQVAQDQLRESIRRLCLRGATVHKGQASCPFASLTQEKVSDEVRMRRAWKQWWANILSNCRDRKLKNQKKKSTQQWIQRQREAIAQRATIARGRVSVEPPSRSYLPEVTVQERGTTPKTMTTKYNKLSSIYTGRSREWQAMVFLPKSPHQRQCWGLPDASMTSAEFPSISLYSAPRTPRDARALQTGGRTTEPQRFSGAIWPGGNRGESLSWDAAEALGWG